MSKDRLQNYLGAKLRIALLDLLIVKLQTADAKTSRQTHCPGTGRFFQ